MSKKKISKDLFRKLAVSLGLALFVILFAQGVLISVGPFVSLEQKHIDERFSARLASEEASNKKQKIKDSTFNAKDTFLLKSKVVILEINDNTHKGIPAPYGNKWPWPREYFARVIKNLNEAGAKAIGIDILMPNVAEFGQRDDSILISVVQQYHNVVFAGKSSKSEGAGYVIVNKFENFGSAFYSVDSSIGIVEVPADNDGIHRRYMPFVYAAEEKTVPSFGFALLNKYYGKNSTYVAEKSGNHFLFEINDNNSKKFIAIPKFDKTSMIVNFYGGDNTFPRRNFLEVLDDSTFQTKDEQELQTQLNQWDDLSTRLIFKDKIVLIGSTLPEDRDIISVSTAKRDSTNNSVSNSMYGIELHANAIQNIALGNFLYRMSPLSESLSIIFLLLISFFGTSYIRDIKIKQTLLLEIGNFILVFGIAFGLRFLSVYVFTHFNYLFTLTTTVLAIILGYFGSTAYYYITEKKQKAAIKGMFSHYVSRHIVDQLINDPEKLRLGGEKKDLTVFFSDLAGFSTFSENKTPEELVSFLNEYLGAMTTVILKNHGTLDKYIGDAVMAFWGAPIPLDNHAYLACKSALEQQKTVYELRRKWESEGQPLINVRMGINTGEMVVGNVGGLQRFDYTVMGDNVNLGSRLEGANKPYHTNIMISEPTYELVKNQFITRELDFIVVKGKTKPIKVYELIAENGEALATEFLACLAKYNEGFNLYCRREFDNALNCFNEALTLKKDDGPSQVYIDRCKFYIGNPPEESWDRVFKMTTK